MANAFRCDAWLLLSWPCNGRGRGSTDAQVKKEGRQRRAAVGE